MKKFSLKEYKAAWSLLSSVDEKKALFDIFSDDYKQKRENLTVGEDAAYRRFGFEMQKEVSK